MSFYDDASLVFLAGGAAGKDGKAYSLKPTDASGDFTFTRGTNLTATRVGKDGYIEKGRENLLLQSNTFDTSWSTSNASVTSGESGYDGTNDAWLVSNSALNGYLQETIYLSSSIYTFSVYVKKGAGTDTTFRMRVQGSVNNTIEADIVSGTINFLVGNVISTSIDDVGGGWFRVQYSLNDSVAYVRIDNRGDNTNTIYIQDAQLEVGLAATDYIETGATTATAGLLEDEPRFDYSGGASCPALLLEPQRSNLLPNSEYFGAWNNARTIDTSNQAISSEGLVNATYLEQQSGQTTAGSIYYSLTFGSTADYTTSIFAKKGEKDFIVAYDKNTDRTYFNLDTGMVGTTPAGVTASIEDFGNGWYRCSATFNGAAGGGNIAWYLGDADNSTAVTDSGGVYIYGAQIEAGSYPTSYIPTYGATATREDENPIVSSAEDIIDITQGTLFIDATIDSNVGTEIYLMRFEGVNFNDTLFLYRSTTGKIRGVYNIGGTGYVRETAGAISGRFKIAFAYDSNNDCTLYVNGSKVGSSFSIPTPSVNLTAIRLGGFNDILAKQSGLTHQSLYFPTALSSNDCEIITGATSYASFASMASTLSYTQYE